MPYLLRVELPDVPGSLGRVAAAIGEAGGDIEAIEIVEHRADGTAVDDVLLETAPGVMPDSLVSACNQLDGVHVLWVSRYGAGGNLFLDLEAVEELTQNPRTARDEIVDLLPITFRADWGMRLRSADGAVQVLHRTSAAPETTQGRPDWFPATAARRLDLPADWTGLAEGTLVAGAPIGGEDELVIFGRRGGPEVLDSELARLAHLAALAASIAKAG
ncbi:MAG: ACT domain-containing protein [Nocardioidaceae bacterium]